MSHQSESSQENKDTNSENTETTAVTRGEDQIGDSGFINNT